MLFPNRSTAGRRLAVKQLCLYANRKDVIVLALPPGGVPVGLEIAKALAAPLGIMVVRRLGVPNRPELRSSNNKGVSYAVL